jgi:UDP-N-acetylglucosamine 1-carboxyvinyltransferase
MDSLRITGGTALQGVVPISGAKNAALPLMAASLLTEEPLTLSNLPHLADIATMANLLGFLGVGLEIDGECEGGHTGQVLTLDARYPAHATAPYDIVRKMRASVLVLGPLLARFGEARVSLPGGCAIGTRPVDIHLAALEQLGAEIRLEEGYILASISGKRLQGADITFPKVSVGATENLLMAASLADGTTILRNAAREPEVGDLAHCLVAMGAEIEGIGSDTLIIHGTPRLHGAKHRVIADRIEAGSYAAAAAMAGGDVLLAGAPSDGMTALTAAMREAGVEVLEEPGGMRIRRDPDAALKPVHVTTAPHPGFPTDMQAQFLAVMVHAGGTSLITETIFENRFMHVPELVRMGADLTVQGSTVVVKGVETLKGAHVMATDLRASMSLVIAGLVAEGTTHVHRIYHLDRGYECLEEKLYALGANVERVREQR